jgi:hypothetical protein
MDSYPTELGTHFTRMVLALNLDEVRAYANTLVAIDDGEAPTNEQLREIWPVVGRGSNLDDELAKPSKDRMTFGTLYLDFGNELDDWVKHGLRFWPDVELFALCRSCEWGYILNLENDTLEVYTGHWAAKEDSYYPRLKPKGRFAEHPELIANPEDTDHPLHLLEAVPLAELRELPLWALDQWMGRLHMEH